MPPFKLLTFANLPAEKYDAAITQGRKINETPIKVFELNTEAFQLAYLGSQVQQNCSVAQSIGQAAAAPVRPFCRFLGCLAIAAQSFVSTLNV